MRLSLRTTALLALGCGAALAVAWTFGLPELSALTLAGAVGLALGAAWLLTRPTPPTVTLHTVPPRVTRGERSVLVVRVANNSGRRTPPLQLGGSLATAGDGILAVGALDPGESVDLEVPLPTPRRGVVPAGPLTMTVTDPLGWWYREVPGHSSTTIRILPRVHPIGTAAGDGNAELGPVGSRRSSPGAGGEDDLIGLRPYVRGDDLRLIHWRTSARRDAPHVVQMEPPSHAPELVVLLDLRRNDAERAAVERAIEAAASVAAASAGAGRPMRLVCSDGWDSGRLEPAELSVVLDALAEREVTDSGDLTHALATACAEPDTGLVVCSTAADPLGSEHRIADRDLVLVQCGPVAVGGAGASSAPGSTAGNSSTATATRHRVTLVRWSTGATSLAEAWAAASVGALP